MEPLSAKAIRAVSFNHNYIAMTEMAVEQLIQCGAKKIAVIMGVRMPLFFIREIEKTLCSNPEIVTKPEWMQSLNADSRGIVWAGYLMKLLFSPELKERPDGLIILNENLLQPIAEVLRELGMTIGKDIHICSHCNMPSAAPLDDGVHFFAFDWRDIFKKAIRLAYRHSAYIIYIFTLNGNCQHLRFQPCSVAHCTGIIYHI